LNSVIIEHTNIIDTPLEFEDNEEKIVCLMVFNVFLHGSDYIAVGFTTTYATSAYHH
jgi:hypothetical protein